MTIARNLCRILLGLFLAGAGVSHMTWARHEFLAQVPPWVPMNSDLVVILSGIVEIALGVSLIVFYKMRTKIGWIAAVFFVLVFPGNIAQFVYHRSAFGLNTDLARAMRLFFQPILILWALWSTGAWPNYKGKTY